MMIIILKIRECNYIVLLNVQVFNWENYLPAHVRIVCQWTCEDYSTCVYYQIKNGHCYLCIQNTDGISDDQLVEQSDDVIAQAHIKVGYMLNINLNNTREL